MNATRMLSVLTRLANLILLACSACGFFAHAQLNGANLGYSGAFSPTRAIIIGLTTGGLPFFLGAADAAGP